MGGKLCKLGGCDRARFQIRTLCLFHIREREKIKRKEKEGKRLARKLGSKKYEKSQLKTWRAKTWKLMSEWVRRSRADFFGNVDCFTCYQRFHWKETHAGHYQHGKLDFDERNLRPQCPACNTYHGGRLDEYTLRLINEHGLEWVDKLRNDAAQHPGYRLDELKEIHAQLSDKLSRLSATQ